MHKDTEAREKDVISKTRKKHKKGRSKGIHRLCQTWTVISMGKFCTVHRLSPRTSYTELRDVTEVRNTVEATMMIANRRDYEIM